MRKSQLSASLILIALLSSSLVLVTIVHFGGAQTSGTNVSGIITSSITWTQADSPYILTGNVLVNNGVTLTIQAGTIINLGSYYIMVNGTLQAIGTSTNPITFNAGQITFTQYSANWNESDRTGCVIEDAIVNSMLSIDSSANISKNTIEVSGDDSLGILVVGGSPIISENLVSSTNYYGVGVSSGTPTITENIISNSAWGISVSDSSPIISENILYNDMDGIYIDALEGASGTANITQNLIFDNYGNTHTFSAATGFYCGIGIGSGEMSSYISDVNNNTIVGTVSNSCGILIDGETATIFTGNNIYGNQYNIYLTENVNVNATYNWWGTTDTQTISETIYDYYQNYYLGVVTYSPFLTAPNAEAPTYINATAGLGGSITPSGIISLKYGGSQTFTITPNTGYYTADILVNGTSVGVVSSYAVQNIQGATTISATFEPNPTPTPLPTPSPTPSPTLSPTSSPSPTATPTASHTASPSPTPIIPEFPPLLVILTVFIAVLLSIAVLIAVRKNKIIKSSDAKM